MKREVLNMGYRSDVAYVIRFGTVDQRDTFIELVNHRNDKHLKQALIECETNYDQPIITFFIENVKWYPDYPEVKAHDQLMEWAVEFCADGGWAAPADQDEADALAIAHAAEQWWLAQDA